MKIVNGVASLMGRATAFVARFGRAKRGNVAMIFAIIMPILTMLTVAGVDIHRAATVRGNLQDALDAAALAAARSPFVTDAELKAVGMAALKANLAPYQGISLREGDVKFTMNADKVIISDAIVDVDAIIANIVLPPYGKLLDDSLPVGAHSEVNRASKNIEVGLVLDITGSMAGQRMIDLKAAANQLVQIVVQDVQTPFYTRMAIVPYSMGVNLGSRANGARGAAIGSTNITAASWAVGSAKSISQISKASPGVVTAAGHGLANDQYVWISGVNGMTDVNGRIYRVTVVDTNKFRLKNASNGNDWSTSGYAQYTSGGSVRRCQLSNCSVVVTSNNHGLSNNEGVQITGVNGMTQLNTLFQVGNVTDHTFSTGVLGTSWDAYTNGGAVQCGRDGCNVRVFRNPSNALKVLNTSNCVSERTGGEAYTDAGPAGAKVGRNYPTNEQSGGNLINPCPTAVLQPLTSNKTVLTDLITSLPTVGSTAGQIGMAWGWYTVAPNFNSLWSGNTAGPYAPAETVKSVIIMTDGEFNTPYCGGVIAKNAGTGSGGDTNKINCDGTNGNVFDQGQALCNAMKAKGIVVYTVGFQIAAGGNAAALLANCASSSEQAYLPANGGDLSEAFADIGRDITRLRIFEMMTNRSAASTALRPLAALKQRRAVRPAQSSRISFRRSVRKSSAMIALPA